MSSSPITTETSQWKELATRDSDGLTVSLFWAPATDAVKVTVADSRLDSVTSGEFDLHVDGADALSAFYHPFAFAAAEGLTFDAADRDSADLQLQS
jgi:hypothetical protein